MELLYVDLGTSIKSLNKNKEVWTSDGRPQVYIFDESEDGKILGISFQDVADKCEKMFDGTVLTWEKYNKDIVSIEEYFEAEAEYLKENGYPERSKVLLLMFNN